MNCEDFYWIVASDTAGDQNNTVANFTIKSPFPLDFGNEKWVVGLAEIIFPVSWYNFKYYEEIKVLVYDPDMEEDVSNKFNAHSIIIEPGHYTVYELVHTINDKLSRVRFNVNVTRPMLTMNQLFHKCEITSGSINPEELVDLARRNAKNNEIEDYTTDKDFIEANRKANWMQDGAQKFIVYISMSERFRRLLGFEMSEEDFEEELIDNGIIEAHLNIDLDTIYRNVFVYTNIMQHVMVGDMLAPLLRVVPVEKDVKMYDQQHVIFTSPFYYPIATQYVNSINISFRDYTGELFSFRSGRSVCTLHFRKVSN